MNKDKLVTRLMQIQLLTIHARSEQFTDEYFHGVMRAIFDDLQEIILELDPVNAIRGED